jgi:hypothetical protein
MKGRMDRELFSTSALMQEASFRNSNLTDFGPEDDHYLEAMRVFIDSSLKESRLRSEQNFYEFLIHCLSNRLKIADCIKKVAEIQNIQIRRPMFITGLPRSGTTIFSRLLAEDKNAKTFQFWELYSPAPSDLKSPSNMTEERIKPAERDVIERAKFGTQNIRPVSLFTPEECHFLFRNSFQANQLCFGPAHRPTYAAWLKQQNLDGVYKYYRAQAQLLLWQRPCPLNGHVIFKLPVTHLENLTSIFKFFPDAIVVNMSRDIVDVMRSFSYLVSSLRKIESDHVDAKETAMEMVIALETCLKRYQSQLNTLSDDQKSRVVTIRYEEWATDPKGTMSTLFKKAGFQSAPDFEFRMHALLQKSPRYSESSKYSLEQFGLSETQLKERFTGLV